MTIASRWRTMSAVQPLVSWQNQNSPPESSKTASNSSRALSICHPHLWKSCSSLRLAFPLYQTFTTYHKVFSLANYHVPYNFIMWEISGQQLGGSSDGGGTGRYWKFWWGTGLKHSKSANFHIWPNFSPGLVVVYGLKQYPTAIHLERSIKNRLIQVLKQYTCHVCGQMFTSHYAEVATVWNANFPAAMTIDKQMVSVADSLESLTKVTFYFTFVLPFYFMNVYLRNEEPTVLCQHTVYCLTLFLNISTSAVLAKFRWIIHMTVQWWNIERHTQGLKTDFWRMNSWM